jgi:hypothetical protein
MKVEEEIPCRKGTTFGGQEEIVEEIDFLSICKLARDQSDPPPIIVKMGVNGKDVSLEVDSGAAVTDMPDDFYGRLAGKGAKLEKTNKVLRTYTVSW